jgi:hypothetical protein
MGLLKSHIARRPVPLLPASIVEPLRVDFAALIRADQRPSSSALIRGDVIVAAS